MNVHEIPRQPLRVLFSHYTADAGGGSDYSLYDLVTHLPRDRFRPFMLLKTGDPMARLYRESGVEVFEIPLVSPRRALGRFALSYLPSVVRAARIVRRVQADVVHVNTLYNLVGPVAGRLACRPVVWHVREIQPDSRIVDLILRFQNLVATRAVANSSAVAKTLRIAESRRRMIPNGTDLSRYDILPDSGAVRSEFAIPADAPVVTVIGRIEPWKGQKVLVEAAPRILERHPQTRFLFVGRPAKNKPEYLSEITARCRELGIEQHAIFAGHRDDIPAVLAASTVVVLPSITPEPFGRVVVEAMAARRPVVATAAGGPLDIVEDGKTGWFVPPRDSAALAERVGHVLSDPEEARALGERGRQRARDLYSLDRLVHDMTALFEEVARNAEQEHV